MLFSLNPPPANPLNPTPSQPASHLQFLESILKAADNFLYERASALGSLLRCRLSFRLLNFNFDGGRLWPTIKKPKSAKVKLAVALFQKVKSIAAQVAKAKAAQSSLIATAGILNVPATSKL